MKTKLVVHLIIMTNGDIFLLLHILDLFGFIKIYLLKMHLQIQIFDTFFLH